jgi:hypothetical protein
VRIDRKSKWGNPFKMDSEKGRLLVIWKYVFYLLENNRLLNDLGVLRIKLLLAGVLLLLAMETF